LKSRKIVFSVFGLFTLIIFFYFVYCLNFLIDDTCTLIEGSVIDDYLPPFFNVSDDTLRAGKSTSASGNNPTRRTIPVKILGVVNAGEISVNTIKPPLVYPSGKCIGIKMYSKGLIVSGFCDFEGEDGICASPGVAAGLKTGDVIYQINGTDVSTVSVFTDICDKSQGKCTLVIERNGKKKEVTVNALRCTDGHMRTGILVKNSVAGVGTMTYVSSDMSSFGALGHPITDMDTIVPIKSATVYEADVIDIKKGKKGVPGEVVGAISEDFLVGKCTQNTMSGVYGTLWKFSKTASPVYAAASSQIVTGKAQIMCSVDTDDNVECFDVEIVSVRHLQTNKTKSFSIRVTDKRLLQKTGGIVQGMSGSPIIQNGKLVGAVTHVFVNDPTRGYGIFIENMLAETEKIK